jgi:hypothetical protein
LIGRLIDGLPRVNRLDHERNLTSEKSIKSCGSCERDTGTETKCDKSFGKNWKEATFLVYYGLLPTEGQRTNAIDRRVCPGIRMNKSLRSKRTTVVNFTIKQSCFFFKGSVFASVFITWQHDS